MSSEVLDLLRRLQSPDNAIRGEAEKAYSTLLKTNMQQMMNNLVQTILVCEDVSLCQFSAILFRGQLSKEKGSKWWEGLSNGERDQLRSVLIERLKTAPSQELRKQVSQIIAHVARLSLDAGGNDTWPSVMNNLASMCTFQQDDGSLAAVALYSIEEITKVAPFKLEEEGATAAVSQLICNVMTNPPGNSVHVRVAAVQAMTAVFSMVNDEDSPQYKPAFDAMVAVLEHIHTHEDLLLKWCESMIEAIAFNPEYVTDPQIVPKLIQPMVTIAKQSNYNDDCRKQCMEVCVSVVLEAPKVIKDNVAAMRALFETCIVMILEHDDEGEPLDDLEGDDQEPTLLNYGARDLYYLCENLKEKHTLPVLFPMISELLKAHNDWKHVRAGLLALLQSVYSGGRLMYNELQHILVAMLPFVIREDMNIRVRMVALDVLSYMFIVFADVETLFQNEEAEFDDEDEIPPPIQEVFGQDLLRALSDILNQPTSNDKGQWLVKSKSAMATSYFFNGFQEGEPSEIALSAAPEILGKLRALLDLSGAIQQEQQRRFGTGYSPDAIDVSDIQSSVLSAIGSIAKAIGAEFMPYYDNFMPVAKSVYSVQEKLVESHAGSKDNSRWTERQAELRGIALECIGSMGSAVGKEKFKNDAAQLLNMVAVYMDNDWDRGDDDKNRQVAELVVNICKSMETVDEMVLPKIMTKFLQWANRKGFYAPTEEEIDKYENEFDDEEDEDEDESEKNRKHLIRTENDELLFMVPYEMKEKENAIRTLQELISSVGECLMPYAGKLAELMIEQLQGSLMTPDIMLCAAFSLATLVTSTESYLKKQRAAGIQIGSEQQAFAQQLFEKALDATLSSLREEIEEAIEEDEHLMDEFKLGKEFDEDDDSRAYTLTTVAHQVSVILRSAYESGGLSDVDVDKLCAPGFKREMYPPVFSIPPDHVGAVMEMLQKCIVNVMSRKRGNPWWTNSHVHDVMDSLAEAVGLVMKSQGERAVEPFGRLILPLAVSLLDKPITKKDVTASLKAIALFFCDDFIEFGGPQAASLVPDAMQYLLKYSSEKNNALRQSAVYGIGLCAEFGGPNFQPHLQHSINALLACIEAPNAREKSSACATDTAVGALLKCIIFREQWDGLAKFLSFLPIKDDLLEARMVYYRLYSALKNQHPSFMVHADQIKHILLETSKQSVGWDKTKNAFVEEDSLLSNETRAWILANIPGASPTPTA